MMNNSLQWWPHIWGDYRRLGNARAFDDMKGIGWYLDYCRRYPEHLIRRAYGEVKGLPDSRIRRSRGALFNYLVQKYAREEDQ